MANARTGRRALIDKANSTVVIVISVAVFVVMFSLVATKTLVAQAAYQNKIISGKRTAVKQLHADIASVSTLKNSYDAFNNTPQNVLGGSPGGSGPQDGTNSKIVLDALPSSYDFPGLTTSLESLLSGVPNSKIGSISGTDDEVAQAPNQTSSSPVSVPIPFSVSVMADYGGIQSVVGAFEKSIRPMQIQTLTLTGNDASLNMSITAQTYYQPAKSLNITKKVVK